MMADTAKQLGSLAVSYDRTLAKLADGYTRQAWGAWSSLPPSDWWNDGVTWGYAARQAYLNMVMTAKARSYADAAASETLRLMGGKQPTASSGQWIPARANTDPQKTAMKTVEEYRHLAMQSPTVKPETWPKPSQEDWRLVQSWLDGAQNRLQTVAETDSTRSGDMSMQDSYRRAGVTHYRRIIHPELSATGTCGLCVVASTRIYTVSKLKAMHDHCHCTILPIIGRNDPGADLNALDLDMIYRKAGGNTAAKLSRLRMQVGEHGELGPILTDNAKVADDTAYESHSPTADFNRRHYSQPDESMAVEQLNLMLERSTRLLDMMLKAKSTGRTLTLDMDGRTLRFEPSKTLNRAISYQREFARQLRSMLGMAA